MRYIVYMTRIEKLRVEVYAESPDEADVEAIGILEDGDATVIETETVIDSVMDDLNREFIHRTNGYRQVNPGADDER